MLGKSGKLVSLLGRNDCTVLYSVPNHRAISNSGISLLLSLGALKRTIFGDLFGVG